MTVSGRLWIARLTLIACVSLVLLPLIYQLGISLKPESQIFRQPILPFAWPPTLENYQRVLTSQPMFRYLINTLIFSLGVTVGQLIIALPAAFAFSYYQFWGQRFLFALVLTSLMVPFVVTYIPNYLLLASWGLLNSLIGMILPLLGLTVGFGIFLLRQHLKAFPKSIMEAAVIDGANSFQLLWFVVIPANISAIAAVAIYILINTWNQFIWPLLVGGRPEVYTLTVAVQQFANSEGGNAWGALMAAAVLASCPTVVLYLFMRKAILRTFTEGAVKG